MNYLFVTDFSESGWTSICPVTLTSWSTTFKTLDACPSVNTGKFNRLSSASNNAVIASRFAGIEPPNFDKRLSRGLSWTVSVWLKPTIVAKCSKRSESIGLRSIEKKTIDVKNGRDHHPDLPSDRLLLVLVLYTEYRWVCRLVLRKTLDLSKL